MTRRTFDPNRDDVFVKRDGRILWDGDEIGSVARVVGSPNPGQWRAEIGDAAADSDVWPPYRAFYARTRYAAVAGVLEDLEIPPDDK